MDPRQASLDAAKAGFPRARGDGPEVGKVEGHHAALPPRSRGWTLFETLVNLQEATDEEVDPAERVKLLASAAKNIATLSRASVNLKKYQQEFRDRAAAAAEQVRGIGERAQISAAVLAEITERIYGLAA